MPTIMFGMPLHNDIYKVIIDNLQYHGFDVTPLIDENLIFQYPNLWVRLQTKFRQKILGDREAKTSLIHQFQAKHLLSKITPHDYALFIRGDTYDKSMLQKAQQNSRHGSINYQWDGMNRYPEIWDDLSYFDRFFVFEPSDYHGNPHGFLPTTNFYFDHLIPPTQPQNTFYYIGAHQPHRQNAINTFAQYAQKQNWQLDFLLATSKKMKRESYPFEQIKFIHQSVPYQDNLNQMLNSSILVDFLDNAHYGLSLRVFEALGYHKKLITTNVSVRYYDFYHDNNIFVWDGKNLDGIDDFLNLPYPPIAPEIREKYAFSNWIKYILNIEPHQKITLPNIQAA